MAKLLKIHPENPQKRLIDEALAALKNGYVICYPTDSGYCLGATVGNKNALTVIRAIRDLSKRHHFTLMMRDLAHIGKFAMLNNPDFRLLKKLLPGAYTFILPAATNVPKRLLHTKQKTIGLRVSNNKIVQMLLDGLAEPMMSVSLIIKGYEIFDIDDVCAAIEDKVELIIDGGYCPPLPTTVIDLSGDNPKIIRQGAGDTLSMI